MIPATRCSLPRIARSVARASSSEAYIGAWADDDYDDACLASVVTGGRGEIIRHLDRPEVSAVVAQFARDFETRGWCHIPHFVSAEVCATMRAEAKALLESDAAFLSTDAHTVYQEEPDQTLPADHPRNVLMQSRKKIVDYARIGAGSPLKVLYNRPELRTFVERVVGISPLHRSACPFNAAMYNGYYDGDGLGWHFDRSEFGVNLVLQEPKSGGTFDYHRLTRSEDDLWAYDAVGRVLGTAGGSAVGDIGASASDGGARPFETVPDIGAGSLVFFAGRLSMHRVAPVVGHAPRINAILTYEKKPGQRANPYSLEKFFGRTPQEQAEATAQLGGIAP
jgi:hypothetical protein